MANLQTKSDSLIGKTFQYLTVTSISKYPRPWSKLDYDCLCICGKITQASKRQLISKKQGLNKRSCGCMTKILQGENRQKEKRTDDHKRLHHIWCGMKARCYDEKHLSYENYGGKGIFVCDEWLNDFIKFRDWSLINGYSKNLSIDRINCSGNYGPGNCRWADLETQNNNKSTSHNIIINGVTKTLTQWAKQNGLNKNMVTKRIMRGMSEVDAVTLPRQKTMQSFK